MKKGKRRVAVDIDGKKADNTGGFGTRIWYVVGLKGWKRGRGLDTEERALKRVCG